MIVRWIKYRTNRVYRCPEENKHTYLINRSEELNRWRTSKNSNLHQKRQWPTSACRNSASGQFYPDRYSIEHVPCLCSHDMREQSLHNDLGYHGDHPLIQLTHHFDYRLDHFFFTMLSIAGCFNCSHTLCGDVITLFSKWKAMSTVLTRSLISYLQWQREMFLTKVFQVHLLYPFWTSRRFLCLDTRLTFILTLTNSVELIGDLSYHD